MRLAWFRKIRTIEHDSAGQSRQNFSRLIGLEQQSENPERKKTTMGKQKKIKMFRRLFKGLMALLVIIFLFVGVFYFWALTATDTSLMARGIIWGTAKTDDWKRYPSRRIAASQEPLFFGTDNPDWLQEMAISDKPLATWFEETNTTAFLILQGGKLVYEGYFNGSGREATQTSMSVAKSFASTLVGIAIEEGFIGSLDDPITVYLPELAHKDARFEAITIRHLITMSSGIHFTRDDPDRLFSDDFITYSSPDLRAAVLNMEIDEAPGRRFHYNDYNPILIGLVLEQATGMTVSEYFETRLWQPMGAEADGSWDLDGQASGLEKMFVGVNGRAIDFAKLGWLFLNEGRNGEKQVVAKAWVEEATRLDTSRDPAADYQYYWWLDIKRQAYYAEGNFCQFIYVYPKADLVLVRHGNDCGGIYWTGLLGEIAQWIDERV